MNLVSLICIFPSLPSTRPFGSSLASGSIEILKLSEFAREQSYDGNKTVRAWSGPKADNIVLRPNRNRDVTGIIVFVSPF
ncbi:hypothetical protein DVH24_020851 [Malus domestica]|uniref:Uncharacterized protein n=1 Tax=Malus domestica TaxID=3750 RepID=A0A498J825_MALDO|nr:hypothetical protein DVH24_020851 [Malus domestica]